MSEPQLFFISDLHLHPRDTASAEAFEHFIRHSATHATQLYILGDLFEAWIGDDQLANPFYLRIASHLADLAARGVAIYFMPGNRDFLCGKRFAQTARLTILPDPTRLTLPDGSAVLLAHGDAYCSDDIAYMRFRRIIRSAPPRWLWMLLPFSYRMRRASELRQRSSAMNQEKVAYVMDVNQATVAAALRAADVNTLIHGHTHRPARHTETAGTRWVLPDWRGAHGGYLVWHRGQWSMATLADEPLLDASGKPVAAPWATQPPPVH